MSHICTEVHAEIRQVFHNNDIVLGCQFADDSQFFIFQTNPCGVVRIGINDSGNIARLQHAFQLFTKGSTSILIDIELHPIGPDDAEL